MLSRFRRSRFKSLAATLGAAALVCVGAVVPVGSSLAAGGSGPTTVGGLPAGSIQHVWLIILENKSYDETFTGLNNNSYLWQTLPSEGVLLKNYYGTGHTSQDNYIALASGQGPEADVQNDCSYVNTPFGSNSTIVTTGSVGSDTPNWNYGQVRLLSGRTSRPGFLDVRGNRLEPHLRHHQRLHLPDRSPHPLRPVQRRRRELEGLRPGPGRRPAHRLDLLRVRQRAGP